EFGRAITYMRRYGYAAVLQIVIDEDDDGNQSSRRKPEIEKSDPKIVEQIKTLWKNNGATEEQLIAWVGKNNNGIELEKLPASRQQAMLTLLKNRQVKNPTDQPAQPEQPGE